MSPLLRRIAPAVLILTVLTSWSPADETGWANHPENRWVRQSPCEGAPAPSFHYEGSGGYDPYQRRWIHHAGHDGIPQGFHTFTFDLDSGRWRQLFPPTSPPGVCCVDGAHVFDAANRRFVRFPGAMLGHGFQWSRGEYLKDSSVWTFDLATNTWMNMRPPPYKRPEKYSPMTVGGLNSGAAYDPNHEVVLTFGGQGAGGGKNTLFAYDAYSNALYHLTAENAPPPRDGMGMTYDARHDKLVLFGGQYTTDERTWLYDLRSDRWESHRLDPHPPTAKVTESYSTIPRLAYDPANGVILCLAWLGEERGHETWSFDTGRMRWTKLNPAAEPNPSKSRSRNLDYDPGRNLFILETSGAQSNRPEIWTYRYKKARNDPLPAPTDVEIITGADGTATLTWAAGVSPYEVHRAETDEPWRAEFSWIGTTDSRSFDDRGLKAGRVYHYVVKAVDREGVAGTPSRRARTQPRVLLRPVVSVPATNRIEVRWDHHPARDLRGYNLYRGLARVRTVRKGTPGPWKDNDPEYARPTVVQVDDVIGLTKLNDQPLAEPTFIDPVDLTDGGPHSGDSPYAVYAYVVRAVNRLGTESGPSPYALTIPSEPVNLLCREQGEDAELQWSPAAEKAVTGYHVYRLRGTWDVVRLTEEPIKTTSFRHHVGRGETRYWVVSVDALGQEGQPSSPAWFNHGRRDFHDSEWHQ